MDRVTPSVADRTGAFRQGLKESAPIALSFILSFCAVGALSRVSNLTFFQSVGLTFFVFAGPAQFAILSLVQAQASFFVVLTTVLIINFRFLIMSFNLVPLFKWVPRRYVFSTLPMLSASTFALTSIHSESEKESNLSFYYYLGVCLGSFPIAVLMTALGYLLSYHLNSSFTQTVPVILPLYFAILLAKEWKKWLHLVAAITAFCLYPLVALVISREWATLITVLLSTVFTAGFITLTEGEKA